MAPVLGVGASGVRVGGKAAHRYATATPQFFAHDDIIARSALQGRSDTAGRLDDAYACRHHGLMGQDFTNRDISAE